MNESYFHVIEVSSDGETWQPSRTARKAEPHPEGAEDYGRAVLTQWVSDEYPEGAPADEYGNPLLRAVIYPADAAMLQRECAAATVYAEV